MSVETFTSGGRFFWRSFRDASSLSVSSSVLVAGCLVTVIRTADLPRSEAVPSFGAFGPMVTFAISSSVTLPLSLLVSILTLHYMGLTINTMSLGGMAIAIGSLVDDAIVDVENVYKRLRENRLKAEAERLSTLEVVFNASKEVRMPILNSTLIIVVSFVPLFFLSGMEGRMLVPLGVAFIVALFASTIVALTLTPVLCSYLLGSNKTNKELILIVNDPSLNEGRKLRPSVKNTPRATTKSPIVLPRVTRLCASTQVSAFS